MSISERIRPGIEAAEWVCVEVAKLEVSYEALRQRVKDLEKELGECQVHFFGYDKLFKELTTERAISDKLEKALKDFVVACDSSICSGAELLAYHAAKRVLAELAAMRKGE